jgi:DNA-binding transcriptional MerR regulator
MPRNANISGLTLAQIERLLNKRRSELERLYSRRAAIVKRLAQIDDSISRIGGKTGGAARVPAGPGKRPRTRAHNTRSLADVMQDILTKSGKPMRVTVLADAVKASGYRSNSADFRAIVNQMLIKDKRFTAAERGFYQMKK